MLSTDAEHWVVFSGCLTENAAINVLACASLCMSTSRIKKIETEGSSCAKALRGNRAQSDEKQGESLCGGGSTRARVETSGQQP